MNVIVDRVIEALWKERYPGTTPYYIGEIDEWRDRASAAVTGSACDNSYFVWSVLWDLMDVCSENEIDFDKMLAGMKAERERLAAKAKAELDDVQY